MEKRTRHGVRKKAEFNAENFSDLENGRTDALIAVLSGVDETGDVLALEAFFASKSIDQIVQAWSYCANTSQQTIFGRTSGTLAWAIHTIDSYSGPLVPLGSQLVKTVLNKHWDVIYRGLFFNKPYATNALLKFLEGMVRFNGGVYAGDIYGAFDFTQRSLPKLFHPKTLPKLTPVSTGSAISKAEEWTSTTLYETYYPRQGFVRFFLALLKNSSPAGKRTMLHQRVAVGGWLKALDQDPIDICSETLDVLTQIVNDASTPKRFKLRFFNVWVVLSLARMLKREDEIRQSAQDFLTILLTTTKPGLRYADLGWYDWHEQEEDPNMEQDTSKPKPETDKEAETETSKQNAVYGIRNTDLLSILKALKPWEDISQQTLVVNTLRECPELVRPYMTGTLGEWVSLTPKLTSFWVSLLGFLCRVVQQPVPSCAVSSGPPPLTNVIESVIPEIASRTSLSKCLQYEVPLVRFLTAQFVFLALNKLDTVLKFYSLRGWDATGLLNMFKRRIPELQVFISSLGSLKESSDGLFKTTITCFLAKYAELFPEVFSSSKFVLPSSLSPQQDNDNGLSLIQTHASLLVQLHTATTTKWYNKTSSSSYSIFTDILRLGCTKEHFTTQVSKLLHKLTLATLLFQDASLCHPVDVFMYTIRWSLGNIPQQEGLWKMIDEAVARCMRQPFKYIDLIASTASSTSNAGSVSPVVAALCEQWGYLDNSLKSSELSRCIWQLARNLTICGENSDLMQKLLTHFNIPQDSASKAFFDPSMHLSWKCESDEFFDFALSAPTKDIVQRKDLAYKIVSPLELYAARFRCIVDPKCAVHLVEAMISSDVAEIAAKREFYEPLVDSMGAKYFMAIEKTLQHATDHVDLTQLGQTAKELSASFDVNNNDEWICLLWLLDSSEIKRLLFQLDHSSWSKAVKCLDHLDSASIDEAVVKCICAIASANTKAVVPIDDSLSKLIGGSSLHQSIVKLSRANLHKSTIALIEQTKRVDQSVVADYLKKSPHQLIEFAYTVLANVADFDGKELYNKACQCATSQTLTTPSLKLLSMCYDHLEEPQLQAIDDFFGSANGQAAVSCAAVELAGKSPRTAQTDAWLNRCIVWLTKRLSEDVELMSRTKDFINALETHLDKLDVWARAQPRLINALLEVLVKWIPKSDSVPLEHIVAQTVFAAQKAHSKSLEYTKLLQAILFNEGLFLDNILTVTVHKLFMMNEREHSTNLVAQVLMRRCGGTTSAQDAILLDILNRIEARTGTSLCELIVSWHHNGDDEQSLFSPVSSKKAGSAELEVAINPEFVANTIEYFDPNRRFSMNDKDLTAILASMRQFDRYQGLVKYDCEFLLGLLISSRELFSEDQVNVPLLISSNSLAFMICCLSQQSSEHLYSTARSALSAVLTYVNTNEKAHNEAIVLLISKALAEPMEGRPVQCISSMQGQLTSVVVNPMHPAYEPAFEYLLSGPETVATSIPVYMAITTSRSHLAPRQVLWLFEALTHSLCTIDCVKMYVRVGIFQWAMSMYNQDSTVFGAACQRLVAKAEDIGGGSIELICGTGAFTWVSMNLKTLEMRKLGARLLYSADRSTLDEWTQGTSREYAMLLSK